MIAELPTRQHLKAAAPALGVLGAVALLTWPAWEHAWAVWSTTEEFSFGFLIPPIALALLIWQRSALARSAGRGSMAALPLVVLGVGMYVLAQRIGINALAGLAVLPILWASVLFLWGFDTLRVAAFPIGFLGFGLGLYRGLLDSVGFAMQGVTAAGAELLGRAVGLGVIRDGLVLVAPDNRWAFIVAEACSGMSSLVSLLALATLWTYVARGSMPSRAAVLLSVVPLVLIANTVRVTLVLQVASWFGQDTAVGFFHGASSMVLFGLALVGLMATSRLVGCRAPGMAAS